MEIRQDEIKLTAEHKTILEQFRKFADKHLSASELHSSTNIEPIKISAILADLMAHGIVNHTESDESGGGWVYILTEFGQKFVSEHTWQ